MIAWIIGLLLAGAAQALASPSAPLPERPPADDPPAIVHAEIDFEESALIPLPHPKAPLPEFREISVAPLICSAGGRMEIREELVAAGGVAGSLRSRAPPAAA